MVITVGVNGFKIRLQHTEWDFPFSDPERVRVGYRMIEVAYRKRGEPALGLLTVQSLKKLQVKYDRDNI